MAKQKEQTYDAWEAAENAKPVERAYYGRAMVDCVAMVFPGKGQRPVVYVPGQYPGAKPFTQITIQLDPLPEMQLSRPVSANWQDWSADWQKITMPSIKNLGFTKQNGGADLRAFNGQYIKFTFEPGFTKNRDPEKPNYKTMKFCGLYPSEEACRKAYLQENTSNAGVGVAVGAAVQTSPAPKADDPAVTAALAFVRSIAENALKSENPVPEAVDDFLTKNKDACAGLTIHSPEIQALLKEFEDEPPF